MIFGRGRGLSVDVALDPTVTNLKSRVPSYSGSLGCHRDGTTINRQNPNRTLLTARYRICVRYRRP